MDCEAEYLKKRWDMLYELRCKVAHNKDFSKSSVESVKKLVSELKPILERAISSLDSIAITEDEKGVVFEKVLSNYDAVFAKFMSRIHRLEYVLDLLIEHFIPEDKLGSRATTSIKIQRLNKCGVLDEKQAHIMHMARKVRNRLVHNEFDMSHDEVFHTQMMLEELIKKLELMVTQDNN